MTLAQGINNVTPPGLFNNRATLVGDILTRVLLFAIIAAGLYFLFRTITSGFSFLSSSGDPAKLQSATRELTHALIGLVIVITVFFLGQLLETILGIKIL